jgi:inositol transport system ATP-binding protein
MDEVILHILQVSKSFPGVQALKDVNFKLKRGEVHALIGENGAGKSTLMKIRLGMQPPSSGSMMLNGKPYAPKTPGEALSLGISMIHQEISLAPLMTVAENIFMGNESRFGKFWDNSKRKKEAAQNILKRLGLDIDPHAIVSSLSISKMQLVEIARAISCDSDIIIMDEPSSSLTDAEVEKLFEIIAALKKEGKSIIYTSHKLDEVIRICDTVTVLRDGKFVNEKPVSKITKNDLISMMVGREMSNMFPKTEASIGDIVLEVKNFACSGGVKDINFALKRGEILGFFGLVGAGRTELVQGIFGLDKESTGQVYIDGKEVKISSSQDAISNKISLVTEDRRGSGIVPGLSVKFNMTISSIKNYSNFGFVNVKKEVGACNEMIDTLSVKCSSIDDLVSLLSGGNQQKIVLGKWLLTGPEVLILDEPTRGIDVGAKVEIYKLIGDMAVQGKGIILVSSELPELFGICDRILVMHQGRLMAEYARSEFDEKQLMRSAFGLGGI